MAKDSTQLSSFPRCGASRLALLLVAGALLGAGTAQAYMAYLVPAGTAGGQSWGGPLGMAFDVNQQVTVTRLGVFDSASDGLTTTITASLYSRGNTTTPLATLVFSPADEGTLVDGSRFKDLVTPLVLAPGFQGMMVAKGFDGSNMNGNSNGSPGVWTTNSGGGALSFVGTAYYGNAGDTYPAGPDGGPANRYAAGTFEFTVPEPAFLPVAVGLYLCLARRRRAPR